MSSKASLSQKHGGYTGTGMCHKKRYEMKTCQNQNHDQRRGTTTGRVHFQRVHESLPNGSYHYKNSGKCGTGDVFGASRVRSPQDINYRVCGAPPNGSYHYKNSGKEGGGGDFGGAIIVRSPKDVNYRVCGAPPNGSYHYKTSEKEGDGGDFGGAIIVRSPKDVNYRVCGAPPNGSYHYIVGGSGGKAPAPPTTGDQFDNNAPPVSIRVPKQWKGVGVSNLTLSVNGGALPTSIQIPEQWGRRGGGGGMSALTSSCKMSTGITNRYKSTIVEKLLDRYPVYKIDFDVVHCGKRIVTSKCRLRWRFGFPNPEALRQGRSGTACRGQEHEIVVHWSITSGKFIIVADGKQTHSSSYNHSSGILKHTWRMSNGKEHIIRVLCHASPPLSKTPGGFHQYRLFIDGQPFHKMIEIYEIGVWGCCKMIPPPAA